MTEQPEEKQQEQAAPPAEQALVRELAATPITLGSDHSMTVFGGSDAFKLAQRMAHLLASSTLVPEPYQQWVQKNGQWQENPTAIGNCVIALEIASRLKLAPLMVMQNLDVVKGRPGFRGSFVTALINHAPEFSRLKYEWKGEPGTKDYGCRAYATETATGEVIYGTWITWAMVTGEGWDKNPKWTTMRDQMFQYRAATFWSRTNAPELLLGMPTTDEIDDSVELETRGSVVELNRRLNADLPAEGPSPAPANEAAPEAAPKKTTRRRAAAPAAAPLPQQEEAPPADEKPVAQVAAPAGIDAGAVGHASVEHEEAAEQEGQMPADDAGGFDFNVE